MKILNLLSNQLNQNGYSKNMQTKGKIGALFAFPINHTPDDCLSCDGYSLLIVDYKDLYKLLGTTYNQLNDPEGTFRVPDYNITRRFLQPSSEVGLIINAGLPNIKGALVNPASSSWSDISDLSAECFSGAFYGSNRSQRISTNADSWGTCIEAFRLDASRSSSIYGSSKTVQPPSQTIHICIKYR